MADLYERGISTGSMSKAFSMAGVRLGWVVAPDEVTEAVCLRLLEAAAPDAAPSAA